MIKRKFGLLLLVLVISVIGAGAALAASDPANAERLYNESPMSGTLVGNRGGAFAYYTIEYPGNGNVVSVELAVAPGDPAAMKGITLKLYNAAGNELGAMVPIDKGLAVLYGDNVAGRWTVQIANYLDGTPVFYTVVAKGLPNVVTATTTAQARATATTTAATTAPPRATPATTPIPGATAPLSGTLTGNSAGAFARIDLGYPANGSNVDVTVFYSPADPAARKGVDVTVYGPNGQTFKGQAGSTPGEIKVTVNSSTPGLYELVISNYINGFTVGYRVTK